MLNQIDLFYATTNPGKVNSLQREFEQNIVNIVQKIMDIPEPRSSDVEQIAKAKVLYAYDQVKEPIVALDAGFYIHSLNGFPKAYVNFALETIGLEGILKLVEEKDRSCEFLDCLAYIDDKLTEPVCFIGHVEGTLAKEKRGTVQPHMWSNLGLIFIPKDTDEEKTLGEMTPEENLAWRKNSREKTSPAKQFSDWFRDNRLS